MAATTKRTELFLDRTTVLEARMLCLRDGRSLSSLVDELLRKHVEREHESASVDAAAKATG